MRLCHITWKNIRHGYNIFHYTQPQFQHLSHVTFTFSNSYKYTSPTLDFFLFKITISTFVTRYICIRIYIIWSMRLRLCYFIMKKYTSRSQHKHIQSCTITITISTFVITVSTFVTRYSYTFTLLLFEVCVYVTSHERIYATVIT